LGVDAEQAIHGAGEVFGADRILGGLGTEGVGLAIDEAALHAASGA